MKVKLQKYVERVKVTSFLSYQMVQHEYTFKF